MIIEKDMRGFSPFLRSRKGIIWPSSQLSRNSRFHFYWVYNKKIWIYQFKTTLLNPVLAIWLNYKNNQVIINIDVTVNSLMVTTSHKQKPPTSHHLQNNCFGSQSKCCFKNYLVMDHFYIFSHSLNHFLGQTFDIFFCFLFLVSDHYVKLLPYKLKLGL